ncbi:pacearchaeosortase [Candidatus Woesearchaeota archaeon]|nr:pacearchaeosortase [Candidatus Woesearchaeota archaeon]
MKYEHKLIIRIILLFLIWPSLLYIIFFIPTIYLSYLILKLIGYNIIVDLTSQLLIINDLKLNFITACVATSAYQLLAILILLTKDLSFKKMLNMFIAGSLLVLAVNVIRIIFLSLIFVNYGYDLFEKFHILLWRGAASFIVFFIWITIIKIFKVKTIPIISDVTYLYKMIRKSKKK